MLTQAEATRLGVEAIFYGSLLFCIGVSSFWAWWRSQLGWTIIAKSLALALAVLPAMIFYWFGARAPQWLTAVSIAALWSVPLVLAWRLAVLWKIQRAGLIPEGEPPPPPPWRRKR